MKIKHEYGSGANLTGEIIAHSQIVQTFIAEEDKLLAVAINFGTYRRRNSSMIKIEIVDEEGNVIKPYVVSSNNIVDNFHFDFNIDCILTKGKTYYLVLSSTNGSYGHTVTAKWGEKKHRHSKFMLNGVPKQGELDCHFIFDDGVKEIIVEHDEYTKGMISIIIPCFNSSEFIEETLKSIKNQTYNFYEIIVVDDHSDDIKDLRKILRKYKIKPICLNSHRGAAYARNTGERASSGQYLFFCDSDVVLESNAMEKMIQRLQENKRFSWVYCNYMLGENKKKFYPFSIEKMYSVNCSSTMSMLRHNCFVGFDENLKKLQDWDLFLTMMEEGYQGVWENETLFTALDRPDGITRNSINEYEAREILRQKHEKIKKIEKR